MTVWMRDAVSSAMVLSARLSIINNIEGGTVRVYRAGYTPACFKTLKV